MQAKDWNVFCSMTLTEILMSVLDFLPDSFSIRFTRKISISNTLNTNQIVSLRFCDHQSNSLLLEVCPLLGSL